MTGWPGDPRRRPVRPGDLLFGDDHDFVVNAYIALLGRWPDDAGYHHYINHIRNRPEAREEVLRALAASEEAHQPGRPGPPVEMPDGPILPSDPRQAMAAALDLRTAWLHGEMERLREALELVTGPGGPELAGLGADLIEAREAALRSEIEALRREMRERLDGMLALLQDRGLAPAEGLAATAEERAARAVSRMVADYVGDMLAVAETRFEVRLRAIEARLIALGGGGGNGGR